MKRVPSLPDLAQLSDAQKDELIVSLWETLVAMDAAGGDRATAAPRSVEQVRSRLGQTRPSRRARLQPGRAPRSRLLLAVLLVVALGFVADAAIGWYQQHVLEGQSRTRLELENAAFNRLYVELLRIAYVDDGRSYRAVLSMHNLEGASPFFVMLMPVRLFVQVGLTWQELPARAAEGAGGGVVKLTGDQEYQAVFQVDAKDWAELLPGYMHIRVDSDMLISRRSDPGDDIVERNNRFYAYLKPQGADDAAIARRLNVRGAPPVFIPMPPH